MKDNSKVTAWSTSYSAKLKEAWVLMKHAAAEVPQKREADGGGQSRREKEGCGCVVKRG